MAAKYLQERLGIRTRACLTRIGEIELAIRDWEAVDQNSFFCAAVVPIFTRLQERRMYSWIEARIHHMA